MKVNINIFIIFFNQRYIEFNRGKIPISFDEFQKVFASLELPPSPVESVSSRHFQSCVTPVVDGGGMDFALTTLADLECFEHCDASSFLNGGEDEGLKMLYDHEESVSFSCRCLLVL